MRVRALPLLILLFVGLCVPTSIHAARRRGRRKRKVKTHVDKKRSIALPVKARASGSAVPRYLRITSLSGDGGYAMHAGCAVCQHLVSHFVGTLHYAESVDNTTSTTGWRMDERKVVGLRGQDEKMMAVFDGMCDPKAFNSMEQYAHCDEKTGTLCEDIPMTTSSAAQVKKSCNEFREEFEESLTLMARQYEARTKNDNGMPAEFCKQIQTCTGQESKRHGQLFKEKSDL
jgi:hypothetical protein